ncbi:hypothetical protein [Amycolatopsis sp. cmx-11-12]|uniref:hypothetical protein n=1 Tax=Amycolatopsis sp. cmx-11-12 TaxID=2785795 RepID=UPI0039186379
MNLTEPRISAGVLLAAPGRGGDAGDKDASTHLTVRGPEWHTDPYFLSLGRKTLLTLFDAEHGLGGISGYDVAEAPRCSGSRRPISAASCTREILPGRRRLTRLPSSPIHSGGSSRSKSLSA